MMLIFSRTRGGGFYDLVITKNEVGRVGNTKLDKILKAEKISSIPMPVIIWGITTEFSDVTTPANVYFLEEQLTAESLKKKLEDVCANLVSAEDLKRKSDIETIMSALSGGKKISHFPSQMETVYITSAGRIMQAKKYAPWNYLPYLSLSRIYAGCNRYSEVIPYAKTTVTLNPNCMEAHKLLALAYKKTGKSFEELEALWEMHRENPDSSITCLKVGEALLRDGDFKRAEQFFMDAINKYKPEEEIRSYARMHVGLGRAYAQRKDEKSGGAGLQMAGEQFKKAINIYPLLMSAYNDLILVYKKMGQFDEAAKIMALAVDITPTLAEDWVSLFEIFLANGEESKAKFCLGKGLAVDPENQIILCTAGEAFMRQGMAQDAAKLFEKAVGVNPSDPRLFNFLGICYRQLNKPDKAIDYYSKALKLDPDDPALHYNLGAAYSSVGNPAAAMKGYHAALRLDPGMKEASEALEKFSKSNALAEK
ncbi:MAG: tetratricopeptide repeat protein [Nitrospinae bacterium]|nr:tetratricopeptide repeat protein [Nitrospinota bacterium]